MPCTRSRGSTTAFGPWPMRQVPTGCRLDTPRRRTSSASCCVGGDRRPGQHLLDHQPLQRLLRGDLAGDAHAGDDRLHIVVAAQEVEPDLRRRQRIGALQPHRAAAFRAQMHRADGEGRERMRDDAVARAVDRAPGGNVHLQVGPLQRAGRCAPARRHRARCPTSGRRARTAYCAPATADAGCCDAASFSDERARDAPGAIGVEVVVQIGADAGQVVHHRRCPCPADAAPGPMPDSSRSCGEP